MLAEEQSQAALDTIFNDIRDLPSPPTLVLEILASFEDAGVAMSSLVEKISRDPAIVARVMRVANSPFYGFSGRIGSVRESVAVLGFNHVRGLVAAASLISHFPRRETGFDWIDFWQHSIRVGNAAKALASRAGVNGDTAFTAGLLHDIGRLVLGGYARERFMQVQQRCAEFGGAWVAAERAVLGVDHAAMGAEVARRWNFPAAVRAAIHDHHHAEHHADAPLSDVVYVANLLAHAMEKAKDGGNMEVSSFLAGEARSRLYLEAEDVLEVMVAVAAREPDSNLLIDD